MQRLKVFLGQRLLVESQEFPRSKRFEWSADDVALPEIGTPYATKETNVPLHKRR